MIPGEVDKVAKLQPRRAVAHCWNVAASKETKQGMLVCRTKTPSYLALGYNVGRTTLHASKPQWAAAAVAAFRPAKNMVYSMGKGGRQQWVTNPTVGWQKTKEREQTMGSVHVYTRSNNA
ncbi:hypothetical protein Tco_0691116 [Tanacetum coccineum]